MASEIIKKTSYYVKKDNEVTKALFFDMSLSAYRIILLAGTDKFLAQLNDPNNKDRRIRISASDFHDVFGKPNSHISPSFRILKQSVRELLNAKLLFKNFKNEHDEGKWSGGVNWVGYAAYNEQLKTLELSFSADILPFLHQVNTKYTYYNLRHIAELTSIHSVRMYELMMFWRKKRKTPSMSVQMMRTWLGISDDQYMDVRLFTRSVVKKAVTEINSKDTNIQIELDIEKTGRNTSGYSLSLIEDLDSELLLDQETSEDPDQEMPF